LRWDSRDGKYETCDVGGDSFHIYIRKSIYTGAASLKTLPLDLEPPLQGKEYGPSYFSTTKRNKTSFPLRLSTTRVFMDNTSLGCRHSTNTAILRRSAPSGEKPLAYLFP
jgi:hypothetical protein